ncbi:hypothetical protein [Flavobacterium sp. 1]|nr:hypothetical protein [Flavobacterium sp. 1]
MRRRETNLTGLVLSETITGSSISLTAGAWATVDGVSLIKLELNKH